jgi:hypothetical protein
MRNYLEAVSVGAFGFLGAERSLRADRSLRAERSLRAKGSQSAEKADKAGRFIGMVSALPGAWLWLHFFIITIALNFPVMFIIARLTPYELFTRLYGVDFVSMLPEAARGFIQEISGSAGIAAGSEAVNGFNMFMFQNRYGTAIMLPVISAAFGVILILQGAFYLLAAFCMGLQRMTHQYLKFRDRLGLLLFSSTLPVFLAALFGFWLPTVHIIVFYFAVILIGFYRSGAA